jgi:mono/diheme cytochrome c family protein
MKKVLKWVGIVIGAIVAIFLIALGVIYYLSNQDLNARHDIEPVALEIPEPDSAMLALGEHLANVRACTGCHGSNLGGGVMIDNFAMGTIASSNLTSGEGGIGGTYTDEDWVRAVRHAVAPDGRPLKIMPSQEFIHLGREDLVALLAYIKQVPPVDWTPPEPRVGPMARALYVLTPGFPLLEHSKIDNSLPLRDAPTPEVSPEYGEYMAVSCYGCHGTDLAGQPSGPPGTPPSRNLTILQDWTEEQFLRAVREGIRPSGDTLHAFMPRWVSATDTEVAAVYTYLQSLEPIEKGQ